VEARADMLMTPQEQDARFIRVFTGLNARLIDWGWLFSGYMADYEVTYLERLVESYENTGAKDERAVFYKKINRLMLAHTYSPTTRAYTVFRAQELPPSLGISHHLERPHFTTTKRIICRACLP
jgi:hypothetical protein